MPVFAVNASMTFWNASRSPPPHCAITVIVRLPDVFPDDEPEPCGVPVDVHAAATSVITSAIARNDNPDLSDLPANIATSRRRTRTSRAPDALG